MTEIVSRDARRLREAELSIERDVRLAEKALHAAERKLAEHTEAAATTAGKLDEAIRTRDELRQRQQAAEPLLKRARDLDTTLKLRHERLAYRKYGSRCGRESCDGVREKARTRNNAASAMR
ncbi:MAG: hypothetical protein R3C19_21760 [Planctomycetaceae bacterium]